MSEELYLQARQRREEIRNRRQLWRMQFANSAMQQLLAFQPCTLGADDVAKLSVEFADAMMKELEKDNG